MSQRLVIYFYKRQGCNIKCNFVRGGDDMAQLHNHPGSPPDPRELVMYDLHALFTEGRSSVRPLMLALPAAGIPGCCIRWWDLRRGLYSSYFTQR